MSIKARGVLIIVCVLCGSLGLLGAGPASTKPAGPGGEPAAVDARLILVEAFVVEVNLPNLAQQGVSPIGQKPHVVAVADILKCLDGGQARVLSGNKIAAQAGSRISVDAKRTIYVRKIGPQVNYTPYDSGGKLGLAIKSTAGGVLTAEFSFSGARFVDRQSDTDVPPVTENWEWSGAIALPVGEPQIAGAVQDGQTGVFLLLVANEQGG